MVTENPGDVSDQTGKAPPQAPPPAAPAPATTPKLEVKTEDGKQVMTVDGRKVVYEADLIAAKKSLEQQMEEAQSVHNEAIDKAKLDLSEAQTKIAVANAEVTKLTEQVGKARESGAAPEDVAKLKQDLDAANIKVTTAEAASLAYRKKLIITAYSGVTEEQLKDKTTEQLGALEEALKAVATSRGGPGPYAIGGTGGGTGPVSDMDRAKALIESTPYRGVREPAPK